MPIRLIKVKLTVLFDIGDVEKLDTRILELPFTNARTFLKPEKDSPAEIPSMSFVQPLKHPLKLFHPSHHYRIHSKIPSPACSKASNSW